MKELCVRIKTVNLTETGLFLEGKVISGTLFRGMEVLAFKEGSQTTRITCNSLFQDSENASKKISTDKVCAGNNVSIIFPPSKYNLLHNTAFLFGKDTPLRDKFVLSAPSSKDDLTVIAQKLKALHYEIIKFQELDYKQIGQAKVINGKIAVETLYPLWLCPGYEVVVLNGNKEIMRGKIINA